MPTIDKYNLKELLNKRNNINSNTIKNGFTLENNNYACFNTKNCNAPELIPIIDIIQYFFNFGNSIGDYSNLVKTRKYQGDTYKVSFKVKDCNDDYHFSVSEDLKQVIAIFKNNRRIDLNDYIELLNLIYYDTSQIEKILI